MLNFALCDDNISIMNKLSKMLESIFIKYDYEAEIVFTFSKAEELLEYIKSNKVDVLILDINLNSNISGIKLAEQIRKTNKKIYIIFTTGHLEYALLAYQVKTFDYIPKPVTTERLENTICRLFDDISSSQSNFLQLANSKIVIKVDDILYIKRDGMKLIYHTNKRDYETYSSFNKIQDNLPSSFIRCHKSYIVNITNVSNIKPNKNIIIFSNNDFCAIGPKYKKTLMEVLNNYGNFSNNMECINNA